MKPMTIACFALFLLGVALILVQMWFQVWDENTFSKLIWTDGCIFAVVFVLSFLIKEDKDRSRIGKDELP